MLGNISNTWKYVPVYSQSQLKNMMFVTGERNSAAEGE
jgi:hypothetical protein